LQVEQSIIIIEIYGNLKDIQLFLLGNPTRAKLPVIGIMRESKWENIRKCGEIGIDRVIHFNELHMIESIIYELHLNPDSRVKLPDILINPDDYSDETIQFTLKNIENNYLIIQKVSSLADLVEVSSCYLTQKFKHHQLKGPKKLLFYMKIRHALWLMEDYRFSFKELGYNSGFESYLHLRRWTESEIHLSLSKIKQLVIYEGSGNFWKYRGPSPYLEI
jgi:AraC-like DNA-binding protein